MLEENTTVSPVFEKGQFRHYLLSTPSPQLVQKRRINTKEWLLLASLLVIAGYVRLYNLSYPNSVVFDEVHFGGFARKYILGTYFMDVHPPLAKMLFGAVGKLGGYNGNFEFKSIGDKFPASTPYVLMRQFPAVLGIATVFLAYFTMKQSGVRPLIAFITSLLLLVENANITISRYILLDSPLIFFIAAAVYAFKKFEIQQPFSSGYFRALVATGIALGLAVSSKWVGLFTIAWVGMLCLAHCWFLIGDLKISSKTVVGHVWWRGSILLGIPAVLYFLFFAVHFSILSNEGDGSAFMSSAFRASLNGNSIPKDITAQVGLGSVVTLRHSGTNGGYLHSHSHFYPTGSKQQQITLYPHLDANNQWLIEPYNATLFANDTFVPLEDGMKIRLKHVATGKRLHSHDEKPPVSEKDWLHEASCYGYDGFEGDPNDDFVVEVVNKKKATKAGEPKSKVRAIETTIRLRHAMTGFYLFSSNAKLPEWGFKQQEVTTASQGKRYLLDWYIETNDTPWLSDSEKEIINYPVLSVWDKFVQSHQRMWKINQGLTDHHNWQSDPQDWPFLLRGINYWVKEHKQVYLFGNAVTWWSVTAIIFAFGVHLAISIVKWHLGQEVATDKEIFNFNYQAATYVMGWALHYFPFFIMGRQLFIHHYLPAYYFGILALGHAFEVIAGYFGTRSKLIQQITFAVFGVLVITSTLWYLRYSALIYGSEWTKGKCTSSKLLNGWDFDCNNFFDELSQYNGAATGTEILPPQQTDLNAVPVINLADQKEADETPSSKEKVAQSEVNQSPKDDEASGEAHVQVEQLVPPFEDEETIAANGAKQEEPVKESGIDQQEAVVEEVVEEVIV
jgi:dolichyl-phosphate-mannose-protein mannosyltransferase